MITGRVRHLDTQYLGIYGQISARLDAAMIRVSDGKLLWRVDIAVTHRKGSIPTSLIDLVIALVGTAMSLDDKAKLAVVDELGRVAAKEVPVSKEIEEKAGVRILAAAHSARQPDSDAPRYLKAGDTIRFAAKLDTEARVRVQVGPNISLVLERDASEPNAVTGSYRVKPGDDLSGAEVSFIAFDNLGNRAEFVDPFAAINIDTLAPAPPTGLKAQFTGKQIKLKWTGTQARDVIAYDVFRSATPLTGFKPLASTEFTTYGDAKPLDPRGYYMVAARDRAGNVSTRTEASEGRLIKGGPTPVSGRILEDTTWLTAASPYVLDGIVTLAPGVTVRIEPGTVILAKPGAVLKVKGQLIAAGAQGQPIVWGVEGDGSWGGIRIEFANAGEESVFQHNRFSAAKIALDLTASAPKISRSVFLRNDVAISIKDYAAPALEANMIRNNRVGIHIDTADPVIDGQIVSRNRETGIIAVAAMPVITNSDLSGNGKHALQMKQQSKGGIVMAENNWWGSAEQPGVKQAISGSVSFSPFLDAAPPNGKPVAAVVVRVAQKTRPPVKTLNDDEVYELMLAGYAAMDGGNTDDALAKLRLVAPYADRNSDLHYRLSLMLYAGGNFEDARAAVEKAILLNRFAAHFYLSQGMILRALGDDGARAAFQQALKLNPKSRAAQRLIASN